MFNSQRNVQGFQIFLNFVDIYLNFVDIYILIFPVATRQS